MKGIPAAKGRRNDEFALVHTCRSIGQLLRYIDCKYIGRQVTQAVSFFALVPILPTGPVDGLLGITLRNVIDDIVAESSYKNFIRHRVIDAGILEEPICTIIITIVDI